MEEEEVEIERLIKEKSPREIGEELRESVERGENGEMIRDKIKKIILNYFEFDVIKDDNKREVNVKEGVLMCSWIMSGGEEPVNFMERLKKECNEYSSVCSEVWSDGHYFFRCRTCEITPSGSICYTCFNDGDHQGHEFFFERSSYGGCCDCGNVQVWKSSGFCPNHKGIRSGDFIQDDLINRGVILPHVLFLAESVFSNLFDILLDAMSLDSTGGPNDFNSDGSLQDVDDDLGFIFDSSLLVPVVSWLRYVGSQSGGGFIWNLIRRIGFGLEKGQQPSFDIDSSSRSRNSFVQALLERSLMMSARLNPRFNRMDSLTIGKKRKKLYNRKVSKFSATEISEMHVLVEEILFFFLDLLQDPDFKKPFFSYYSLIYHDMIELLLAIGGDGGNATASASTSHEIAIVYKLSPQLLCIPSLIEPFCIQQNFLDINMSALKTLFERISTHKRALPPAGSTINSNSNNNAPTLDDSNSSLRSLLQDFQTQGSVPFSPHSFVLDLSLDCTHPVIASHGYYAFTNDLYTLITHPPIAAHLIRDRPDLLSGFSYLYEDVDMTDTDPIEGHLRDCGWLRILSLAHGLDPHSRRKESEGHIEWEGDQLWRKSFGIELELARTSSALADCSLSVLASDLDVPCNPSSCSVLELDNGTLTALKMEIQAAVSASCLLLCIGRQKSKEDVPASSPVPPVSGSGRSRRPLSAWLDRFPFFGKSKRSSPEASPIQRREPADQIEFPKEDPWVCLESFLNHPPLSSGCMPISLHSPLHRFFSRHLSSLFDIRGHHSHHHGNQPDDFELQLTCGSPSKQMWSCLIEQPLLNLALCSQVKARLWTRNGSGLLQAVSVYRDFCRDLIMADVFLLQCGIVALGSSHFLIQASLAFEIETLLRDSVRISGSPSTLPSIFKNPFNPRGAQDIDLMDVSDYPEPEPPTFLQTVRPEEEPGFSSFDSESKSSIIIEFLELLITLETERGRVGDTTRSSLKNALVHALAAAGDIGLTHSQVAKVMSERASSAGGNHHELTGAEKKVVEEEVLGEVALFRSSSVNVATFSDPSESGGDLDGPQGVFVLKKEAWVFFDPFYRWHTEAREREKALVNFEKAVTTSSWPLPTGLPPTYPAFQALGSLLHDPILFALIRHLLLVSHINGNKEQAHPKESLILCCLHLMLISLLSPPPPSQMSSLFNEFSFRIKDVSLTPDSPRSILEFLIHLRGEGTDGGDYYHYLKPIVEFLVNDPSCKFILSDHFHLDKEQSKSQQDSSALSDAKRKAAKEKQAAALAFIQKQQQAFLQKSKDSKTEKPQEDEPEAPDGEHIFARKCALCEEPNDACGGLGMPALLVRCSADSHTVVKHFTDQNSNGLLGKWWVPVPRRDPKAEAGLLQMDQGITAGNHDIPEPDPLHSFPEFLTASEESPTLDQSQVKCLTCNHFLHFNCYRSYFETVLKDFQNNPPFFQQYSDFNPTKGEFRCPLCRRLCNVLFPIQADPFTPSSLPDDCEKGQQECYAILTNQGSASTPHSTIPLPSTLSSCLSDIALRIDSIQNKQGPPGSQLHLIDLFESNLSGDEIVSRHQSPSNQLGFISSNRLDTLHILAHSAIYSFLSLADTDRASHFHKQRVTLSLRSIFSSCMFSSLVHFVIAWPSPMSLELFLPLLKLHYLIVILQAAIHISKDTGTTTDQLKLHLTSHSSPFSENTFSQLKTMCLSFLRRAFLLMNVLFLERKPSPLELPLTFEYYQSLLHLPSPEILCSQELEGFSHHMEKNYWETFVDLLCSDTYPGIPKNFGEFERFSLISLPDTLQELLLSVSHVACAKCGNVPKQGGLCLLCGRLVCVASRCCEFPGAIGEAYQHTQGCTGLFLLLKTSHVLFVWEDRRALLPSFFLDEHGEQDSELKRTLFFNQRKYQELFELWLTQLMDHRSEVIDSTSRDGQLM